MVYHLVRLTPTGSSLWGSAFGRDADRWIGELQQSKPELKIVKLPAQSVDADIWCGKKMPK